MSAQKNPNQADTPVALNRLFTNRVEETKRFEELLNRGRSEPLPLLMFWGVGGAGKSSLLLHLSEKAKNRRLPVAHADLQEYKDTISVLKKFTQDLKEQNISLPNFERALTVYLAYDIGQSHQINGTNRRADLALDVLGLFPPFELVINIIKVGKSAIDLAAPNLNLPPHLTQQKLSEEVSIQSGQTLEDRQRRLVHMFAEDLCNFLPSQHLFATRSMLIFDTHESLWSGGKRGLDYADTWIQYLREKTHGHGILMVMAGRDKLNWSKDNSKWQEVDESNHAIWLEQHHVGGLSRDDATAYLQCSVAADTKISQELVEAILQTTTEVDDPAQPSSHHCYLLYLCAETMINHFANKHALPSVQEFGKIPKQDVYGILLKRFLESLESNHMKFWFLELSLTPRFDKEFALAIDRDRHHNNGRAGWERLIQLSLIQPLEDGFYEMHKLLQEGLQVEVSEGDTKDVHEWSWDYWTKKANGQPDHPRYWGLAWYHHRFVNPIEASSQLTSKIRTAERTANLHSLRYISHWYQDVRLGSGTLQDKIRDCINVSKLVIALPPQVGEATVRRTRALDFAEKAMRLSQTLDSTDDFLKGSAFLQYGRTLAATPKTPNGKNANENRNESIPYLEKAIDLIPESEEEWGETHRNLGRTYRLLATANSGEHISKAKLHYEKAIASRNGDFPSAENGLALLKRDLFVAGSDDSLATSDEIEKAFHKLISSYEDLGFTHEVWRMKHNLANTSVVSGEFFPISSEKISQHIEMCKELLPQLREDTIFTSLFQTCLGNLYRLHTGLPQEERFEQSLSWLNEALKLRHKKDRLHSWEEVQLSLGLTHLELGQDGKRSLHRSIEHFESILTNCSPQHEATRWSRSNHYLGRAHLQLGNENQAKAYLEKALAVYLQTESLRRAKIVKAELAKL